MYIEKKSSRRIRIEQNIVETQWHGATTALRRRSYTCCHNSKRALRYGIPTPRIHISPASSYMAAQVLILHIYWHSTTPLHLHQAGRQAGRQAGAKSLCLSPIPLCVSCWIWCVYQPSLWLVLLFLPPHTSFSSPLCVHRQTSHDSGQ